MPSAFPDRNSWRICWQTQFAAKNSNLKSRCFCFFYSTLNTKAQVLILGIGTIFSIKLSSRHVPPEEFVRDLFTIKIRWLIDSLPKYTCCAAMSYKSCLLRFLYIAKRGNKVFSKSHFHLKQFLSLFRET